MIKIVLDTNVFVSGLLYGGMSHVILRLITDNKLQLCISDELTKEVIEKFKAHEASEEQIANVIEFLGKKGDFVIPTIKVIVSRDPKDNYLLELAETSLADYLITRDKDLLELPNGRWRHTIIIKPEDFLPLLRKMGLFK